MKLSLRARAALQYFANSDATISAEALSEVVTEGRDAILTAMKELRGAGLMITRRERVNNRVVTVSYITEAGFQESASWALKSPLQIQHSVQNSNISLYAYSALNIKKTTRGEPEGEEETMGYDFFSKTSSGDSELQDAKRKDAARRKAEYEAEKQKAHEEKVAERINRKPADWNMNQLVNYFAQRINETWGLKPWSLAGSQFYIALGKSRKKYGTTAGQEKIMMDIFFDTLRVNAETDSNLLWRKFLSRFSELAPQAELQLKAPEQLDKAVIDAEASWKGM